MTEKREIKFRAWMLKEKQMVEISDLHFITGIFQAKAWPNIEKHFINNLGYMSANYGEHGNPIMQFTGLKDKNGKEIYQDDILNIDGLNVKVEWYNGAWTVEYFTSPKRSYLSTFDETDIEVVGNVWENPELLK